MSYTAKDAKWWRLAAGSLAKKLAIEFGLVQTQIDTIDALEDGKILVGNGSDVATEVDMSGDATIANTGAVTIGTDAVTAAKIDLFLSSEITSDAGAKAEAHGLGATPSVFFPILQETGASTNPNLSATADATNVWVTAASTDVKYLVLAIR